MGQLGKGKCCGDTETEKCPIYEYRDLWAEESGAANAGSAEWSFGNGATGFIGIPFPAGWELIELGYHADTYAANTAITVDLMSYVVPSNAAGNTVASISLANAADGGGTTNNAWKVETFDPAVPVPAGPVGFITRGLAGAASDHRVSARFRRLVKEIEVPAKACEEFSETIARPTDTPNTGWANENIVGTAPTEKVCVTITAATGNTPQMIGLNSDPATNASYASIDHAIYFYKANATQRIFVYENGGFVSIPVTNWVVGDTVCVERVGGNVEYSLNGTVFATTTATPGDLFVDSSFYYAPGFWGTGSISLEVSTC